MDKSRSSASTRVRPSNSRYDENGVLNTQGVKRRTSARDLNNQKRNSSRQKRSSPSSLARTKRAEARRAMDSKKRRAEWFEAFFEAGIIALVLFFFFWPTQINGASMQETFYSGDRVVMSRVMVYFKWLNRNDIIICRASEQTNNRDIIKRIIGIPGDRIAIVDGKVLVNGEILDEPYTSGISTSGNIDIILDRDEYFIMGDNREVSFDSRDIGPISKRDIIGKVLLRYYPLSKIKFY